MKKPGTDLVLAAGWVVFGAAVLAASWRMERLENLHVNPWSVPGLMPGVLGGLMVVFGAALGVRSLRRPSAGPSEAASLPRIFVAIGLCVAYAAGLLGQGIPFWLSSAAFLFIALLSFRWLDRDDETPPLARLAASSAAIAIGAALAIGFLFEQLFLVRLP